MPTDLNFPCEADETKGEILYDWSEDHIHEFRHKGTSWIIRLQRVKENAAIAFIQFRDFVSNASIRIPRNVHIRDETGQKDVYPYPYGECFRITPFSSYSMLIHVCVPALRIDMKSPPYFSIITPAANVIPNFIRQSKPQEKRHWEKASTLTPEEEEEENQRKLALLMAEPHWDTFEETFPPKAPLPLIKQHPDKKPEAIFNF